MVNDNDRIEYIRYIKQAYSAWTSLSTPNVFLPVNKDKLFLLVSVTFASLPEKIEPMAYKLPTNRTVMDI